MLAKPSEIIDLAVESARACHSAANGSEATRISPARQERTANWITAAIDITKMNAAISMSFDLRIVCGFQARRTMERRYQFRTTLWGRGAGPRTLEHFACSRLPNEVQETTRVGRQKERFHEEIELGG